MKLLPSILRNSLFAYITILLSNDVKSEINLNNFNNCENWLGTKSEIANRARSRTIVRDRLRSSAIVHDRARSSAIVCDCARSSTIVRDRL